ncbi:carbohydrate kinase family protein [Cystobacter fuscus]
MSLEMLEQAVEESARTERTVVGLPTRLSDAGPRWELLRRMQGLILNQGEASLLLGMEIQDATSARLALRRMHAEGVAWAAITLGAGGVVAGEAGRDVVHCLAAELPIASTLGAGDAFAAGLLAGLSARYGLEQAVGVGLKMARRVLEVVEAVRAEPCRELLSRPWHNQPGKERTRTW